MKYMLYQNHVIKNVVFIVSWAIVVFVSISLSGCEKEEKFDSRGVVLLTVVDLFTGNPVPHAQVKIYDDVDDWAFEQNQIGSTIETNEHGELMLPRLMEGLYYFDVTKDAFSNWQYPFNYLIENEEVEVIVILVGEDINRYIATASGRRWEITTITNDLNEDISNDPEYACLIGNKETYYKSGLVEIDRGASPCDPDPAFTSASWWGTFDFLLHILPPGGADGTDYTVISLEDDAFVVVATIAGEEVFIHYTLDN